MTNQVSGSCHFLVKWEGLIEDKSEERHNQPTHNACVNVVPSAITDRLLVEKNTSFMHRVADLGSSTNELQCFCKLGLDVLDSLRLTCV